MSDMLSSIIGFLRGSLLARAMIAQHLSLQEPCICLAQTSVHDSRQHTFEAGCVVADGELPHMRVHRYGRMLVQ